MALVGVFADSIRGEGYSNPYSGQFSCNLVKIFPRPLNFGVDPYIRLFNCAIRSQNPSISRFLIVNSEETALVGKFADRCH